MQHSEKVFGLFCSQLDDVEGDKIFDRNYIAGIGNAYIHDILFLARLHPLRPVNTLSEAEIAALAAAIRQGLQPSLDKGGAFYELDLRGRKG